MDHSSFPSGMCMHLSKFEAKAKYPITLKTYQEAKRGYEEPYFNRSFKQSNIMKQTSWSFNNDIVQINFIISVQNFSELDKCIIIT